MGLITCSSRSICSDEPFQLASSSSPDVPLHIRMEGKEREHFLFFLLVLVLQLVVSFDCCQSAATGTTEISSRLDDIE
jgi:hypothetical protein